MKYAIIYYSYSGTTRLVAGILSERLKETGTVETVELKPLDESKNFFAQCGRAATHVRAKIETVSLDLSSYDEIFLGTPVWAFAPAPAMNTCLDQCSGMEGKSIVLFTTYGSGTGNGRCLRYMQGVLAKKGAGEFKYFSVQGHRVKNKKYVLSQIMRLWPNG